MINRLLTSSFMVGSMSEKALQAVYDKITHAFDPVIIIAQALAYPVTYITMATAFLLLIRGKRHAALKIGKWAIIGYLGMQWLPAIMDMIREIGQAMRP